MRLISLLALGLLVLACGDSTPKVRYTTAPDQKARQQTLMRANEALVRADADSIGKWVAQHAPQMQVRGRGLWWQRIEAGTGPLLQTDQVVQIRYRLELLDGRLLYTSDSLGPKRLRVGQAGVESGLEEALLWMHLGDSVHLILPPHLAHGLTGDQQRVPPRAIVQYRLRVQGLPDAPR